MTASDLPNKDEMNLKMQKRIAELEKANQDLRAENMALNRDITERKRAEEALKLSEERFAKAFAHSAAAMSLVRLSDGVYLEVNEAWINMFGYSYDDVIGRNSSKFKIWEDEDSREKMYRTLREKGLIREEEYTMRRASGEQCFALVSAEVITIANEQVILASALDITKRKRAEEVLRESEAYLLTTLCSIQDEVWIVDAQGCVVMVNQAVEKNLGVSQDRWGDIHAAIADLEILYPDGTPRPSEMAPLARSLHGETLVSEQEIVRNLSNSELRWREVSCAPIRDPQGHITGAVLVARDITERKKDEEALRKSEYQMARAQEIARMGSWEVDVKTNVVTGSRELYEMWEIDPESWSMGTFTDKIHPDDRQHNNHSINAAIYGHKPYDEEFRILTSKGERIIHSTGRTIYNEYNRPITFFGIVQDITERKRAEETLRESELKYRTLSNTLEEKVKERTAELEEAYTSLREIETIRKQEIHHRIKNNLQVISSLLDLQAEKFRGKKNIEDSQILEAFKESQDRVISMALIHEELHKGGTVDTINFSHYIEELADNLLLTYRVRNNGVILDTDIEEDVFFDMDTAVPLGIIINELLSNSLKYAFVDRDKGEIQIKLHREENIEYKIEDCKITNFTLSISDNGVGVPEDFDIEDVDSLGLQLVTTLVDQIDGELELRSNNGAGFTIRFSVIEKGNQTMTTPALKE